MSKIFENKTVLISGASGGIGRQIVIAFAKQGANVALQYHTNKPVEAIESIQQYDIKHCAIHANICANNFQIELLNQVENKLAKPDILVNCAASQDVATYDEMTVEQFEQMMKSNLTSTFALSREFANRLTPKAARLASIINISSIEGTRPALGHGHYAASKAAVEMLTKSMALEYGPKGLRVNAIAPGLVARKGIETAWPDGVKSWNSNCPMGRMANASDIANAALFLASEKAAFINGTTITVDGGMSVTPGW